MPIDLQGFQGRDGRKRHRATLFIEMGVRREYKQDGELQSRRLIGVASTKSLGSKSAERHHSLVVAQQAFSARH